MDWPQLNLVMLPQYEWEEFKRNQAEILQRLKEENQKAIGSVPQEFITAKEFMDAVRIKRTKFDQLVQTSKIKILKNGRKIYVPVSEVDRYFKDGSMI